jgi:hypothetical protein
VRRGRTPRLPRAKAGTAGAPVGSFAFCGGTGCPPQHTAATENCPTRGGWWWGSPATTAPAYTGASAALACVVLSAPPPAPFWAPLAPGPGGGPPQPLCRAWAGMSPWACRAVPPELRRRAAARAFGLSAELRRRDALAPAPPLCARARAACARRLWAARQAALLRRRLRRPDVSRCARRRPPASCSKQRAARPTMHGPHPAPTADLALFCRGSPCEMLGPLLFRLLGCIVFLWG